MASFSVHALTSLLVPLYALECIILASVTFRIDDVDFVLSRFRRSDATATGNTHQSSSVLTDLTDPTNSDAVSLGFLSERGVEPLPLDMIRAA
jgi:hypothetical protein